MLKCSDASTLSAIGDRRVVPDLIAPLKRSRFDCRFHIPTPRGSRGGPEGEAALKDLAASDPFLDVRGLAAQALKKTSGGSSACLGVVPELGGI